MKKDKFFSQAITILWAVVIVAVIGFVAWVGLSQRTAPIPENVPDYLVPNSGVKPFVPVDPTGYTLAKRQSLGEGITYTLDTTQKEAVKETLAKMQSEGWVAVAGSNQEGGNTTLKMGRETEAIFIIFEGGQAEGEKTTIKVVPVEVVR